MMTGHMRPLVARRAFDRRRVRYRIRWDGTSPIAMANGVFTFETPDADAAWRCHLDGFGIRLFVLLRTMSCDSPLPTRCLEAPRPSQLYAERFWGLELPPTSRAFVVARDVSATMVGYGTDQEPMTGRQLGRKVRWRGNMKNADYDPPATTAESGDGTGDDSCLLLAPSSAGWYQRVYLRRSRLKAQITLVTFSASVADRLLNDHPARLERQLSPQSLQGNAREARETVASTFLPTSFTLLRGLGPPVLVTDRLRSGKLAVHLQSAESSGSLNVR